MKTEDGVVRHPRVGLSSEIMGGLCKSIPSWVEGINDTSTHHMSVPVK